MFLILNKICKICFFINIGLLAYGTWLDSFDLIVLSILNMILLTPAFLKEKYEFK